MAHTIGRTVVVDLSIAPGGFDFDPGFSPDTRFVILHFTGVSLGSGGELSVELGYDRDVFRAASGADLWTRPIDPRRGPIHIQTTATITLHEYAVGERTAGTEPARPNVSHADPFLHTSPYQEPDYETTFLCGSTFDWVNVRAAAATDPIVRDVANAVCLIVSMHRHGATLVPSSCTGTLIGPDLILTAHHCYTEPDGIDWKSASVTFDYETADAAGNRPASYSPFFYKVTGLVGRSRPQTSPGEWALLQIQTPAAGLGITPRDLRTTPVMSGERVIAVHHPHGSPKKFQGGSPTTPLTPRFDFAGGSSGSSLFDAMGRVIGGPLSSGGGCSATYTAATTVLADLASPPPPSRPLDVVLVLDRSGSMAQTAPPVARTKLQEMQSAAAMFVRLVREGAGDRLGIVSYSSTASMDVAIQGGEVTVGHKNMLVGPGPSPGGVVGGLMAGGSTTIGGGLQRAVDTINAAVARPNDRVLLLMTDGLHNTPPSVDAVSFGATRLGIVGFGHDHELDGPFLRQLAGLHDGAYTRASNGLDLRKMFALRFGNVFEAGAILDPEVSLPKDRSEADWQQFVVCGEETVTIVVTWDDPRSDLDALVQLPDGSALDFTSPDVTTQHGDTWWFVRVRKARMADGMWRYRVRRVPVKGEFFPEAFPVRAASLVIPKGGPTLTPIVPRHRLYTGDPLALKVGLFHADGTAPHGEVVATIQAPAAALGALVQTAPRRGPVVDGDPLDVFRATLQGVVGLHRAPVPMRNVPVKLFDDGNQLDGSFERDGFFTNTLADVTRFEGTYTVHARARYECGKGFGMRETTWSVYVEPGIDASHTPVDLEDVTADGAGGSRGTIRVRPHDRYGNPLGPGRPEYVDISVPAGTRPCGGVRDGGDGSYTLPVAWPSDAPPRDIIVTQPDRPGVCIPLRPPVSPEVPPCPECTEPAGKLLDCLGLRCHPVSDVRVKSVCVEIRMDDCKK